MIGARTRVFAVLGDPVAHSLSPAIHNAAFRATGLDACYVALACGAGAVGDLMRALAAAGGGGNVTVPHKATAVAAIARPSEMVSRLGAANTFWGSDGAVAGDNTDVEGILAALAGLAAPASAWLVIGTGGSARAVAAAAAERGAALAVRSRDPTRGRAFAEWATALGAAEAEAGECEVVINATPLGLKPGDALPCPASAHPRARVALDLVYAAGGTRWVTALRVAGLRAADGRDVLVAQGAAAFSRWFPKVAPPVEVMRAAVARALA